MVCYVLRDDVPSFSVVGMAMSRRKYITCKRRYIAKGLGADFSTGTDMSGSTALMHSISTKPYFDHEFAQLMLDAGGDINRQDRFGGVTAHDIATIQLLYDHAAHEKAGRALQWYLEHGGKLDVKDGDDTSVREIIAQLEHTDKTLKWVMDNFDQKQSEGSSSTIARPTARNSPCPCGSGRKFKKCCGKE